MFSVRKHLVISFLCATLGWTLPATATEIFTDNFDSGASELWGNESGNWAAAAVYSAGTADNFPATYSSLPFELQDFVFEVNVDDVFDGGIWLRSTFLNDPNSGIGVTGVLLVTGAKPTDDPRGTQLFWHIVEDGESYGGIFNVTEPLFEIRDEIKIRIEVIGNTYSAFLNDSTTPATTLTTDLFSSGRVALYDFSVQSFDNVRLSVPDATAVPEPPTITMFVMGLIGLGFMMRRRQRVV